MKFFSKNKIVTDPEIVINDSVKLLVDRITNSFNESEYHWNKSWGIKRFESMVLAKFIIDYSFNGVTKDKLNDDEKLSFIEISSNAFSKLFNNEFSSVGLNYDDMIEEINLKIESYYEARRENKPPVCWHKIYQLITRSKSKEDLEEDIKNKISGLELIKGNDNFAGMVPQYEAQIKILKDMSSSFESAEMMLPHMIRFTNDHMKVINLKKIKSLSKKLGKKDKAKKK
jgi:hypothetical protein